MDLALNDDTGDLDLQNADLFFVTKVDATRQHVAQRLRMFLGEWFLDESRGVPYYDRIFVKNPNPAAVDSILKTEILTSPGIEELTSFSLDLELTLRQLRLEFSAISQDGEIEFSDTLGG